MILENRNKIEIFSSWVRCSSFTVLICMDKFFPIAESIKLISHNYFNRLRLVEKGEEQFSDSRKRAAFFII